MKKKRVNEESRLANNDDADQRTSVKKKRVNEESRLANNDDTDQRTSVKKKRVNKESHLANNDNVNQPSHSYTSNNINSQRVHVSDNSSDEASSSSIRNKSLSDQRLLTSRTSPPLLLRSHSPESLYDQQSLIPNIALFSQIKEHSFHNTDYQQLPTSKVTNVSSLSLIGPFKSNLKICLYLVKHPSLINLALSMMKADGQEAAITCGKVVDKFSALPERHHMDVTDVQKTFRDQAENVDKFSNFIRSAFKLFVQEDLLDKDVVNEFKKNLNLLTVDMRIFTADGNETLQQLDLWSFLKLD
ncbi:hypothetical protein C2G38_2169018 [Gigaspora rosea]|uniref:Uncharacterized protein n=1 Tax=Gigaspora rosea TaxID=44941 RepID=A0A397VQQ6_9GLOM|nr:hypothetical protein C2G38_2169018 [Gigaspora rosea]